MEKQYDLENGSKLTLIGGRRCRLDYTRPRNPDDDVKEFFRFRGRRYYLEEFMRCPKDFLSETGIKFDGYLNDSFFSGIAIRLPKDSDEYVIPYLFMV